MTCSLINSDMNVGKLLLCKWNKTWTCVLEENNQLVTVNLRHVYVNKCKWIYIQMNQKYSAVLSGKKHLYLFSRAEQKLFLNLTLFSRVKLKQRVDKLTHRILQ